MAVERADFEIVPSTDLAPVAVAVEEPKST
jgi:hypothetical protein